MSVERHASAAGISGLRAKYASCPIRMANCIMNLASLRVVRGRQLVETDSVRVWEQDRTSGEETTNTNY